MGFFINSSALEIHVINFRGQDSLKTQTFVQKNREIVIAIYLCKICFIILHLYNLKISSYNNKYPWSNGKHIRLLTRGSRVRILAGPTSPFSIFFSKNETKGEEICGDERVGEIINFSW